MSRGDHTLNEDPTGDPYTSSHSQNGEESDSEDDNQSLDEAYAKKEQSLDEAHETKEKESKETNKNKEQSKPENKSLQEANKVVEAAGLTGGIPTSLPSSTIGNVHINGTQPIVILGNIIHSHGDKEFEKQFRGEDSRPRIIPPGFERLREPIIKEQRCTPEKCRDTKSDAIRFYYKNNLIQMTPVPWVKAYAPELDDYFTELIIRQLSKYGKDSKENCEFDFRKILQDTNTGVRHCILVEGSPGYGKTTLAKRIAVDWGRKADYLKHFQLVVFITCRDLNGQTLESYASETYPQYHDEGSVMKIDLKVWCSVSEHILFILDGLDELSRLDAKVINEILEGTSIYSKASVLATSRPLPDNTSIHHMKFTRKVLIKGFNQSRIKTLIESYFKDRSGKAEELKEKMFSGKKAVAYQRLATCPLLCQLFCILYEDDERLPDKTTDVYYNLIKCLIRRHRSASGKAIFPDDSTSLPPEYENMLRDFGQICIGHLIKDQFYFKKSDIEKIVPASMMSHADVIMGFLVKSSSQTIFDQQDCYQPLHKTFLEFVASFYLKSLVLYNELDKLGEELDNLENMEWSSLEQVLEFTVEMLGEKAHHVLRKLGSRIHRNSSSAMLRLLNSSGCTNENIQAVTSVMDLKSVTVKSSLLEIEAWTNIATKSNVMKKLKFQWDPKCDSLTEEKIENFFHEMMRHNTSIDTIQISMFNGQLRQKSHPDYAEQQASFLEELNRLGQIISLCMRKPNLENFEVEVRVIQLGGDDVDYIAPLVENIVHVMEVKAKNEGCKLKSLSLNLDLGAKHLQSIVNSIIPCHTITHLSLGSLCSDVEGFQALAELLIAGNLLDLKVSLNITKFWSKPNLGQERLKNRVGSPKFMTDPFEMLGKQAFLQSVSREQTNETNASVCDEVLEAYKKVFRKVLPTDSSLKSSFSISRSCQREGQEEEKFFHIQLDSTVCPLPLCNEHGGYPSGFHYIFKALKDPRCKLESLSLDQCILYRHAEYLSCLGGALRQNKTLRTLKVETNLPQTSDPNIQYGFPLMLSLQTNHCLSSLDLGSLSITVNNKVLQVFFKALSKNTTLSVLSISTWRFHIDLQDYDHLESSLRHFLAKTHLQSIDLEQCEVVLKNGEDMLESPVDVPTLKGATDALILRNHFRDKIYENSTVRKLNMCGMVIQYDRFMLKPRDVVPVLGFRNILEIDISDITSISENLHDRTSLMMERTNQLQSPSKDVQKPVTDVQLIYFLENIMQNMGDSIEVLKMVNWVFKLAVPTETIGKIKPILESFSKLHTVSLNNMKFEMSGSGPREPLLLKAIIKYIPNLQHLSILRSELTKEQVPPIIKALKKRVRRNSIVLHTKHVTPASGLDELLKSLRDSKTLDFHYDCQSGVITVSETRKELIFDKIKRLRNKI